MTAAREEAELSPERSPHPARKLAVLAARMETLFPKALRFYF